VIPAINAQSPQSCELQATPPLVTSKREQNLTWSKDMMAEIS